LAEAGHLQPIPESHFNKKEYAWQDLLAIFPDRLLSWKGKVYGLPLLGEAPLCFFRLDLFSNSEHQKAFRDKHHRQLSPPATWEEFL
jgi:maltose-binding protein MalE